MRLRSSVLRVALPVIFAAAVAGCSVSDADIDHWKHTVRGPGKITSVLVGAKYPEPLRVHAARALIEMKHPNANGLDLLVQAMTAMDRADRETIIRELLPSLRNQMRGADQQQTASGPTEPMIRAKDAAYLLLRFAAQDERRELSAELLNWLMADYNTRALAGQYTGEQVVSEIGSSAVERLVQQFTPNEDDVKVSIKIAELVNSVGTDQGKDAAVTRLVSVARDISGDAGTARLRTQAQQTLERNNAANPQPITPDRLNRIVDFLRGQYLNIVFEAIRIMNRPTGTEYLISVASTPSAPLERRKAVLGGVANQVRVSDVPALLAIANAAANTDIELRGIAVDRLGETRSQTALAPLYAIFDNTNGGETGDEYLLRWKAGEAILKLSGPTGINTFIQHMTAARRPATGTFEGYTFRETNGYALTVGDFSPPPRDAMRALLSNPNTYVKALAVFFLGAKGEARDVDTLERLSRDATPMQGPGWAASQTTTLGAVAARARDQLRHTLGQAPAAPAPSAAPPPAAAGAAPAH